MPHKFLLGKASQTNNLIYRAGEARVKIKKSARYSTESGSEDQNNFL